MSRHTPGPWQTNGAVVSARVGFSQLYVCQVSAAAPAGGATYNIDAHLPELMANAHLIAAAPDHAAIARVMCAGVARWEPFASGGGEFCIGGIRHATKLDEFGVPVITGGMRVAIAEVTSDAVAVTP
jgi:hypothetical protein